jgi:predicted nucleic acid-binding protein
LVSELIRSIQQVPFDGEAAREAARVRVDLEKRGLLIGPFDLLIAGTALSRGATLVTNNMREFSRVPASTWKTGQRSELLSQRRRPGDHHARHSVRGQDHS